MELTVIERLLTINLLPTEGNLTTIKLCRVAREALSFTEEEHKELNFRQEGTGDQTRTLWNPVEIVKDIKLGEVMTEKIKEALKKKNEDKTLTDEDVSLYEKFVG